MGIDINAAIAELQKKRKVFCSEADFQLELAWVLKEQNPDYQVRLEYVPSFNKKMHIDIVLMKENEFIPIELKYKTKYCEIDFESEHYSLANHGAQDVGKYLYLKDIERIENIREKAQNFTEGYSIFITNDPRYIDEKQNTYDAQFSLTGNKTGSLDWGSGVGNWSKKYPPILLKSTYKFQWGNYSIIETKQKNTNKFYILASKIARNN